MHQAGLVHRDIKPANVILREGDRLVLIDFGADPAGDAQRDHELYADLFRRLWAARADAWPARRASSPTSTRSGRCATGRSAARVVDALARQNSLAAGRPDPQPSAATIGAGRYPGLVAGGDRRGAGGRSGAAAAERGCDARHPRPDEPAGAPTAARGGSERTLAARTPYDVAAWVAAAAAGAVALAGAAYFMLQQSRHAAARRHVTARPCRPRPAPDQAAGSADARPTAPAPEPQPPQPSKPIATPPQREPYRWCPPSRRRACRPPRAPAAPSPFDQAQDAARSLPCAVLRLAAEPDGVRVVRFRACRTGTRSVSRGPARCGPRRR